MVRLFVGLELSPLLKESLIYARGGVLGARWQRDDQLHLTLAFIGEVSRRQMFEIEDTLAGISVHPFELQLSGVGSFGKPGQPKSLWAGIADEKPVAHLHKKVLKAMEGLGLQMDRRRFKPHVTLARFAKGNHALIGDWMSENGDLKSPAVDIGGFTLFSSALTSEGSCYSVEARFGGENGDHMADMNSEFGSEVFV